MKLVSFSLPGSPKQVQPGLLKGEAIFPLPYDSVLSVIEQTSALPEKMDQIASLIHQTESLPLKSVRLHAPLPNPRSLRDAYAFEQHVAAAYANRNRPVPEEWYQFPVFYFSNHLAVFGPGEVIPYPAGSRSLDYELEVACIIGKEGRDIQPDDAEEHIFGYTIFNDWSARDIQRLETRVGLGPAKGKDFASSFGPWIVTPDELADHSAGRPGVFDLEMRARINGRERSCGNWKDIHYSFGEIITRMSAGVTLHPGEVIGSGTVGTGCLLEITRNQGPWLQPGDQVALEIQCLGILANQVEPVSSQNGAL